MSYGIPRGSTFFCTWGVPYEVSYGGTCFRDCGKAATVDVSDCGLNMERVCPEHLERCLYIAELWREVDRREGKMPPVKHVPPRPR